MHLLIRKKLGIQCFSRNNIQLILQVKFAGKTPFDQKQPTQSPFVTPRATTNWNSSKVQKQVRPTIYPQPEPQKITPLNSNSDIPGVQAQIKSIKQPPSLDFQFLSEKKIFKKDRQTDIILDSSTTIPQQKQQTVAEYIMTDLGLNRYLSRVFTTTGISVAISLCTAYTGMLIPNVAQIGEVMFLCCGLLSYGCFQKARTMDVTILSQVRKGEQILRTKNHIGRLSIYGIGCTMLGLSASPLFYSLSQISLNILPMTMGVTTAIFGGASLMGFLLPRGFMLGYGSVLTGGLFGLLGLNFSGMLAAKYLGMSLFAATLSSVESFVGIGLFSALLIFDTHVAIKRYRNGDADHLGMSIQILLDVMNLIIRIARQIAKHKLGEKNKK